MKVVVTHASPDLDAITSVWLIKKFLPGWQDARVKFVPAGERIGQSATSNSSTKLRTSQQSEPSVIERIGQDEAIHVDTGLGPLDHHQTDAQDVSAASLTYDFVMQTLQSSASKMHEEKIQALKRIVAVVVSIDHFKEVFWENPTALHHDFSLIGILDGLKIEKPDQDMYYVEFIFQCLDAVLHSFENRIWAEQEIAKNGKEFTTRFGKGIGFETINDSVLQLAQKMGYVVVIRKDPRKGYVRIKAKPSPIMQNSESRVQNKDIDLTPIYQKLKELDSDATWFLHVSKKMLLNGSVKNPTMKPTTLSLEKLIEVVKEAYI